MTVILLSFFWVIGTLSLVTVVCVAARFKGYALLVGTYSALVVIAMLVGQKLVPLFGFDANAGAIVFAASFLLTDIITETYGETKARLAVWAGFVAFVFYFFYSYITVVWPPLEYWSNQAPYAEILLTSARITVAGGTAFLISQFLDIYVFGYFRERHGRGGWRLGFRNILSTSISQGVDTLIFITIAFAGLYPILDIFIGTYIVKLIIALLDTPFVYIGSNIIDSDTLSLRKVLSLGSKRRATPD